EERDHLGEGVGQRIGLLQTRTGLRVDDSPPWRAYPPLVNTTEKDLAMNTVLITGCSSGYGLETARHFLDRGWNVVATMRSPREDVLPRSPRLSVLPLDVTSSESIAAAIEAAGPLNVL